MEMSDDEKLDILQIGTVERQLELEALAEMIGYHVAKSMRKILSRRR